MADTHTVATSVDGPGTELWNLPFAATDEMVFRAREGARIERVGW